MVSTKRKFIPLLTGAVLTPCDAGVEQQDINRGDVLIAELLHTMANGDEIGRVEREEDTLRVRSVLGDGFSDSRHFGGIATGEDETGVACSEMVRSLETDPTSCASDKDCFVCHVRQVGRGP